MQPAGVTWSQDVKVKTLPVLFCGRLTSKFCRTWDVSRLRSAISVLIKRRKGLPRRWYARAERHTACKHEHCSIPQRQWEIIARYARFVPSCRPSHAYPHARVPCTSICFMAGFVAEASQFVIVMTWSGWSNFTCSSHSLLVWKPEWNQVGRWSATRS